MSSVFLIYDCWLSVVLAMADQNPNEIQNPEFCKPKVKNFSLNNTRIFWFYWLSTYLYTIVLGPQRCWKSSRRVYEKTISNEVKLASSQWSFCPPSKTFSQRGMDNLMDHNRFKCLIFGAFIIVHTKIRSIGIMIMFCRIIQIW